MTPCFGAPADYVAAFDTLDGSKNGAVSYAQPRVYLEDQSWATPEGQIPGHGSEHMHVGACWPQGLTLTDAAPFKRIDVGYVFHNMVDYKITEAGMSAFNGTGSSALYQATPEQIAALQVKMDASIGHLVVQQAFQSYPIVQARENGLKESRGGLHVVQSGPAAVFEDWRLDIRHYFTYNYAGLPLHAAPNLQQFYLRNRSVTQFQRNGGTSHDYHHSGRCAYDLTRADFVRYWPNGKSICLRASDGGGQAYLEVDPNHHIHCTSGPTCDNGEYRGIWFKDLGNSKLWPHHPCECAYALDVSIPTAGFAPGLHKMVFLSSDSAPGRGTWTNVNVWPFRVR